VVLTAPAKQLNGNARLAISSLADADLRAARKERAELLSGLRKLDQRIATMESILAVAGVETVTIEEAANEWRELAQP
jgi:hypothetical protein